MKSVAARMATARFQTVTAITEVMKKNEIPAYIMESVLSDVLGDIRNTAKLELLNEIERESNNNGED